MDINVIERRLLTKPVFQFKGNKFKVAVLNNDEPVLIIINSHNGGKLFRKKYSPEELMSKTFDIQKGINNCLF